MKNCKKYLIDGGYFIVNLKNFKKYKIYDDTKEILDKLGLKFVCTEVLNNKKRRKIINTDEKIMVFQK